MITAVDMKIVLASRSPRRSKILSELGYEFTVAPAGIDESPKPRETPVDHVLRLASIKAEKGAENFPDDLVIGADTDVVLDGEIMGKPESENNAFDMLTRLSGRTHTVYTGLSLVILNSAIRLSDYDHTEVEFNDLSADQIHKYIKSGEPLDKAGSYGIQGMGSFLVKRYSGDLDTVIGFPSRLFNRMYEEALSCLSR